MSGASASADPHKLRTSPAVVPRDYSYWRLPLLAAGALALLTGLCGGLWRIGWELPHGAFLMEIHGPLLILGVFGNLISLERAVALKRVWPYAAPVLVTIGTLALLGGAVVAGALAYTLAAAVFVAVSVDVWLKQRAVFTAALIGGALSWLVGNALWLTGAAIPDLVGWWLAFLILTIGGERLEFSRLLETPRGSLPLFLSAAALLAAGAWIGPARTVGGAVFGTALALTTVWLLRHDIVRRTIWFRGQPRFMAACLLTGYVWLGVAGALLLFSPPASAPFGYDIAVHAILIGFVLSMVFGHALIILPSIVRIRLAYSPVLYLPIIVLHGSVAMRIVGGLGGWQDMRMWSGLMTVAAILLFILLAAVAAVRPRFTGRA